MAPIVDKQKCTGCSDCIAICPIEAIILKNGKAFITIECVECGTCIPECPEEAIALEDDD